MSRPIEQERYVSPLAARTVPESVCHEIADAWERGYPATPIRPLEPGEGANIGACEGSPGNFNRECLQPVVAVQHTVSTGEPRFYCYEHALKTDEWDTIHYRSQPPEVPELTEEQLAFIQEALHPKRRRKREREESEP